VLDGCKKSEEEKPDPLSPRMAGGEHVERIGNLELVRGSEEGRKEASPMVSRRVMMAAAVHRPPRALNPPELHEAPYIGASPSPAHQSRLVQLQ